MDNLTMLDKYYRATKSYHVMSVSPNSMRAQKYIKLYNESNHRLPLSFDAQFDTDLKRAVYYISVLRCAIEYGKGFRVISETLSGICFGWMLGDGSLRIEANKVSVKINGVSLD